MTSKTICFDARMAQASGIGTYIRGLLGEFERRGKTLPLLSGRNDNLPKDWPRIPVTSRFYSPSEQVTVPWAFHRSKAELLHVPHYNLPVIMASRCIVTVHDLIHLKFPEFLPSKLALLYAKAFFHHWVPRARAILTVSENTKRDMVTLLGIPESKITVTYLGVSGGYHPLPLQEYEPILRSLAVSKGYFLYVGNLKDFKNVSRLLESYKLLKQHHPDAPPFVFVGRNFIPGFDLKLKGMPGVTWLSELDQTKLAALYSGARALVFPSLYEGFGLPPLEAMACGTPVICSNRGSLPEVVGDSAILVDPLSTDAIEGAMKRIWMEPALAAVLSKKGLERAKQFDWKTTADKTLQVYESALA